jgi:protein-L-isoaspartate(D-aspartate) O-methyltransferase
MNFARFDAELDPKQRMIAEHLRGRGIRDERVLTAMARVPRERFVAAGEEAEAYADAALPIACGQTISQPYIVGMMSEALDLIGDERVLEIGTGSGYQTAVLAELAGEVYSIERHAELSRAAGERLSALGYQNVQLRIGDGSLGWPAAAPFDRIIITAAGRECPPALWEQLAEGGLLIGPFGSAEEQTMMIIRKRSGQAIATRSIPCRFVPLVSDSSDSD